MAKDNDFGLSSNADQGVSQEAAVQTIDRVAGEPAPTSAGQTDLGVAQADGKKTDDAGLRKEFDLNDPNAAAEPAGEPEKETEVETDPDAEKPEKPDAKAEKPEAPEKPETPEKPDENVEAVAEWLGDVDVATRQDILDEFVAANIDDLNVTVRQAGQDVEMSLGQLKRQAAGYAGEDKASRQIKTMQADIDRREKELKDREKFITDQFNKPSDLMVFLDSHVEDPVAYFTAVKEHAEGVLAEAEENPARFRREAAMRRENVSLRSDMAEIKDMIRGRNGKPGTPEADAAENSQPEDDDAAGRKAEGEARVSFVKEQGFKVDAVAKAWTDAGEPVDFYRWFATWGLKQTRDTSTAKVTTTKKNRQKGGASLRRRGSANPAPAQPADDGKPLDAKGIATYLKNHPSNKGRL